MDHAVDLLLRDQRGVARRDQLVGLGLTTAEVRSQLRARRWQSLGAVVVVAHNGPLNRNQQWWAGVLASGCAAVLAGLTALEAAGLRGWAKPHVHVLVPRAATRSEVSGIARVLHETRRPPEHTRTASGCPPGTTVERSVIDAGSWERDTRTRFALVAAAVQQRLTTAGRLAVALDAAGPVRHHRSLRLVIGDIGGGAEALSEIDFSRLCRHYDLGTVVRQEIRLDGQGRRRYLDGVIVGRNGRRIAFEVDGSIHLLPSSYWDDMHRQNELLIANTSLLRFSGYASRFQQDVVADQLRRALAG